MIMCYWKRIIPTLFVEIIAKALSFEEAIKEYTTKKI